MTYYFNKVLDTSFDEAVSKITETLKDQGFGVLTEIDLSATMKKKLDVDMPKYKILGACHPPSAYQAIQAENKIGLMLPCNVIVQENANGKVEVSAIDPIASMQAVQNDSLGEVATDVREKLQKAISNL